MTGWVDAHHHVWDLDARDQPWITGDAMAPLRRAFSVDDLADEAKAAGVDATVAVMTVADITETEELLDLARGTPLVAGVVGYVDLLADDVEEQLDRLLDRDSGRWLVGVRSLAQDEPDRDWLRRPDVVRGLRCVAARGLAFDLLVRADQLAAAAAAAAAVEDGRFVLDHLAKPSIAEREWEPWASDLAALAERPNVVAKLSGLVTEARWSTWNVDDLRPYVDHALDTFGPERLLFGSDWPVCTLAATYTDVVAAASSLVSPLSDSERWRVTVGNARATYRLEDREAT